LSWVAFEGSLWNVQEWSKPKSIFISIGYLSFFTMFPQMWKNENYKVVKGRKLGKIDIETSKNTINPFSKNYKFFLVL
jgi:hypothetical protein